jgi:hypothetical protein
MNTLLVTQALTQPAVDRNRSASRERHTSATEPSFSAQIAAYYPFPRIAADNLPRALMSAPESRLGQAAPTASLARRRHGRND